MSMSIEEYALHLKGMLESKPQSIIRKNRVKRKRTLIRKQFTKPKQ